MQEVQTTGGIKVEQIRSLGGSGCSEKTGGAWSSGG